MYEDPSRKVSRKSRLIDTVGTGLVLAALAVGAKTANDIIFDLPNAGRQEHAITEQMKDPYTKEDQINDHHFRTRSPIFVELGTGGLLFSIGLATLTRRSRK